MLHCSHPIVERYKPLSLSLSLSLFTHTHTHTITFIHVDSHTHTHKDASTPHTHTLKHRYKHYTHTHERERKREKSIISFRRSLWGRFRQTFLPSEKLPVNNVCAKKIAVQFHQFHQHSA